ncbi:MAG: hypothetical protein M3128_06590 [Verrucomicrobiota bacterium]|nr:hypothetical protein [Verrucomicrobiota bacterium]
MNNSPIEPTDAQNLEEKFAEGEDVLDYFDPAKGKVIEPSRMERQRKSDKSAVIREDSPE